MCVCKRNTHIYSTRQSTKHINQCMHAYVLVYVSVSNVNNITRSAISGRWKYTKCNESLYNEFPCNCKCVCVHVCVHSCNNNALITTKANKSKIINTYTVQIHTYTWTHTHMHAMTTATELFIRALKSAESLSCEAAKLVLRPLSFIQAKAHILKQFI